MATDMRSVNTGGEIGMREDGTGRERHAGRDGATASGVTGTGQAAVGQAHETGQKASAVQAEEGPGKDDGGVRRSSNNEARNAGHDQVRHSPKKTGQRLPTQTCQTEINSYI